MRAKSAPIRKQVVVSKYHNTAYSGDIPSIYLDFIATYSYTKKTGEACNVWDSSGIIKSTLAYNPEVRLLKEQPEHNNLFNTTDSYKITNGMNLSEIRELASKIIRYDNGFNQGVIKVLEKASIKSIFDIGIHLTSMNVANLSKYIDLIKEYQKKSKKSTLSIYIMANYNNQLTSFKNLADPTWKITSLTKNIPLDGAEAVLNMMAEVQIMTVLPALILDFYLPIDRFIYMMHRNIKEVGYFKEINNIEWSIQQPRHPPRVTPAAPTAPAAAPAAPAAPPAPVAPVVTAAVKDSSAQALAELQARCAELEKKLAAATTAVKPVDPVVAALSIPIIPTPSPVAIIPTPPPVPIIPAPSPVPAQKVSLTSDSRIPNLL
jgi:hypothetical protein